MDTFIQSAYRNREGILHIFKVKQQLNMALS